VFTLLTLFKLEDVIEIGWLPLCIPLAIGLAIIPVTVHIFLYILSSNLKTAGNLITIIAVYLVAIGAGVSFILISAKMDEAIDADWAVAFVPSWITVMILLCYGFFICPGLTDASVALHRQAFLIILYMLGILVFSILACLKLSEETDAVWGVIFTPIWTVVFINFLSMAWEKAMDVKIEVGAVLSATTGLVLISLRLDGISVPWAIVMLPFWVLLIAVFVFLLWSKPDRPPDAVAINNTE
jgi:hypothetical protein